MALLSRTTRTQTIEAPKRTETATLTRSGREATSSENAGAVVTHYTDVNPALMKTRTQVWDIFTPPGTPAGSRARSLPRMPTMGFLPPRREMLSPLASDFSRHERNAPRLPEFSTRNLRDSGKERKERSKHSGGSSTPLDGAASIKNAQTYQEATAMNEGATAADPRRSADPTPPEPSGKPAVSLATIRDARLEPEGAAAGGHRASSLSGQPRPLDSLQTTALEQPNARTERFDRVTAQQLLETFHTPECDRPEERLRVLQLLPWQEPKESGLEVHFGAQSAISESSIRVWASPMSMIRTWKACCLIHYEDETVIKIPYERLGLYSTAEGFPSVLLAPADVPSIEHVFTVGEDAEVVLELQVAGALEVKVDVTHVKDEDLSWADARAGLCSFCRLPFRGGGTRSRGFRWGHSPCMSLETTCSMMFSLGDADEVLAHLDLDVVPEFPTLLDRISRYLACQAGAPAVLLLDLRHMVTVSLEDAHVFYQRNMGLAIAVEFAESGREVILGPQAVLKILGNLERRDNK
eukprot:3096745-Amphidinium_carterae.1